MAGLLSVIDEEGHGVAAGEMDGEVVAAEVDGAGFAGGVGGVFDLHAHRAVREAAGGFSGGEMILMPEGEAVAREGVRPALAGPPLRLALLVDHKKEDRPVFFSKEDLPRHREFAAVFEQIALRFPGALEGRFLRTRRLQSDNSEHRRDDHQFFHGRSLEHDVVFVERWYAMPSSYAMAVHPRTPYGTCQRNGKMWKALETFRTFFSPYKMMENTNHRGFPI